MRGQTSSQWYAEVWRGTILESRHRCHAALVGVDGGWLAGSGDASLTVPLRSAAKPFQALSVVVSGAADRWGLDDRELAVVCASHPAGPEHLSAVLSILAKIGESPLALRCGPHWPGDERTLRAMHARQEQPTSLHNNCSGKHAGMLATAKHLGASLDHYLEADHPVQQLNRSALALLCGVPEQQIMVGIDGCGVPTFAVSLSAAALGYARLSNPEGLPPDWAAACRRVTAAMTAYPDLVQVGEVAEWMRIGAGRWVVKGGAEGYLGVGGVGQGIGVAAKNEDGSARGLIAVVLTLLEQQGLLTSEEQAALLPYRCPAVLNTLAQQVGSIRAVSEDRHG